MEFKEFAMNVVWIALAIITIVIIVRVVMDLITDLIVAKQREKVIKELTNKIADDVYKDIEDLSNVVEFANDDKPKKRKTNQKN